MKISEHTTSRARLREIAMAILNAADADIPEYGYTITFNDGGYTDKQRAAMHVYFRLLAATLNDAGLDMRRLLKPEIELPWTEASVKEHLWRPIQRVMLNKSSTTELERPQVSDVYKVLDRFLGEKHGVHVPFPQNKYPEE